MHCSSLLNVNFSLTCIIKALLNKIHKQIIESPSLLADNLSPPPPKKKKKKLKEGVRQTNQNETT